MKRKQKLLLVSARVLLGAVVAIAGILALTACGESEGVVRGAVRGVDPSAAQIEVVIYELSRVDQVSGMNVFQKGAILQQAPVDKDGAFAFTLEPAEYVVQVSVNGVTGVSQLIEVKPGRTITLELETTPPPP